MQQQQSYYGDCYNALNEYFTGAKLTSLNTALAADTAAAKRGVPNPCTKTVPLLKQALCYGSYPNYVFANGKAQTEITEMINNLSREFLVTLQDPFDNTKLNIIEYSSSASTSSLFTNVGNQKVDELISFYAYFPVIQGEPYRLTNFLQTLKSKDNTRVGSISYTKALQKELASIHPASNPNQQPNSSSIWPITHLTLIDGKTFANFQTDVVALNAKLKDPTKGYFNTFAGALVTTFNTSTTTATYYENYKTLADFENALAANMATNKVNSGFVPATAGYTYSDLINDVNSLVAQYFTISPPSVVLQASVDFEDFVAAIEVLKENLDGTLYVDFHNFVSDLNHFYDEGEEFAYYSYTTIADFEAALKDDLENQNFNTTTFKASAAKGTSYKLSDFEADINQVVADYFTIGAGPNSTSDNFSEFQQKIKNLQLVVTTNTKGLRQYAKKSPQISQAEFTATIGKLNQSTLNQLSTLLTGVLAVQQSQEQLLVSDIDAAKQRNKIMETNLNGRMIINVGNYTDAETIVRQLLANEHIKENVFAIKLKYQEAGATSTLVEHSKIEIVYEQGVFTRLGFNLDYIDSIGNALKSELVEIIAINGIKGEAEFFPFYHKLGSSTNFNSGVAWGDDYPITNAQKTFVGERCIAIAQTMLFLQKQANVLASTYGGNIVLMLQSEGRVVSDTYFRNNDVDAYIPYLRYSVR